MTEHPQIRCPGCGKGAVDIAPDFDPFEFDGTLSVSARCPKDHVWIEHRGSDGKRVKSGVVGTPGWADNSPGRSSMSFEEWWDSMPNKGLERVANAADTVKVFARAAWEAGRGAALEEAARKLELTSTVNMATLMKCADIVRSLKSAPAGVCGCGHERGQHESGYVSGCLSREEGQCGMYEGYCGCDAYVAPINTSPGRVEETPERRHDLVNADREFWGLPPLKPAQCRACIDSGPTGSGQHTCAPKENET